jgi:hypothetical protein
VRQSVAALGDWWTGTRRGVEAEPLECPEGCSLGAGHRHLCVRAQGHARRIDLEALFWGDYVEHPGRGRCAWLVLQAGLVIGLVVALITGATAFERLSESGGNVDLARSLFRLVATFIRAVFTPLLTLLVALSVLVSGRLRATLGDALAWTDDPCSRRLVQRELLGAVRAADNRRVVLIGHSQGGSIATELEPILRADGRDVWLVTLGSGHGLLAAMHSVLPRWSLAKSILSWTAVLTFSSLTIASLALVTVPNLRPLTSLAMVLPRVGGVAWFSNLLSRAEVHTTLKRIDVAPTVKVLLGQPFHLPPIAMPAEMAATVCALLLVTIGLEPIKRLRAATRTEAPGIDIVATHDLVAAAMMQLSPIGRRCRVSQCGSLLFDHTSYLRNTCVVPGLLVKQIECAAGLPADQDDDLGAMAMEEYHRAGLGLRSWTRPLLCVAIVGGAAWFAAGRVASAVWLLAAGVCCLLVSIAVTCSSKRWLTRTFRSLDADYRVAVVRERDRWRRARPRWAGVLALFSVPLLGGSAVAFSPTASLRWPAGEPGLPALTLVAFAVGLVLCALAWRTLFGFQRGPFTVAALALGALMWMLQGARESATMAVVMLALAGWAYRRERHHHRLTAAEYDRVPDP